MGNFSFPAQLLALGIIAIAIERGWSSRWIEQEEAGPTKWGAPQLFKGGGEHPSAVRECWVSKSGLKPRHFLGCLLAQSVNASAWSSRWGYYHPETQKIHLPTEVFYRSEENMAHQIALALPAFVWKLSWYLS